MLNKHNSAVPNDNKLPILAADGNTVYMKCNAFLFTASSKLTINPKDGKGPSLGSRPMVHHRHAGLMLLPVSPLGKSAQLTCRLIHSNLFQFYTYMCISKLNASSVE